MALDATFWATIGLVIFLAIIAYLKVPGMLAAQLDQRAERVRGDLDEARRLREEAEGLRTEYAKRKAQAEKDAADLVAAAKREADQLVAEARAKSEDYVARRTALAEQKIGQAERDAVNEVRAAAVDIAVEAARKVLAAQADEQTNAAQFQSSVNEVRAKLN
ncbi:F0F1 ATP synthase subunit B [Mesorhizobium sp. RP14(2022)]|uniref:ATP synthase subunit b n=1 Tax=Mesorhizobium liriopis TaxID=2953882 RepID=A0ABT1C100_9HYPH|nr:F0F1 ATP synthase subunit B [Mesorhizobium liriopis]MCO6048505.1 F0F1 ATP synthase subunit B [Mesorhizobium liriopis]